MANKQGIDYGEVHALFDDISTDSLPFSEGLLLPAQHHRKLSQARKIRAISRSEEELRKQTIEVLHAFPFSLHLLNLLRAPKLTNHAFSQDFLAQVGLLLRRINPSAKHELAVIYLHLLLAQIDNLAELEELEEQALDVVAFDTAAWNETNVLNPRAIHAALASQPLPETALSQLALPDETPRIRCEFLLNRNAYVFEKGCIRVSWHYVELALLSWGHLDVYFGPFLLNKFSFEASLWFNNFHDTYDALSNYAAIFQQIAREAEEFAGLDYSKWYGTQVERVVGQKLQPEELATVLNFSRSQEEVERLLIGLLGWRGVTEEAVKLLNVYYDNCDWQLNSEFNSLVAVTGESFEINYLVESARRQRETTVVCIKAPCASPYFHGEVFSWHRPKLVEYISDDESYAWVQLGMGKFAKSGFYDWALFNLADRGKDPVLKILDIGTKHKMEKSPSPKQIQALSVKSVKGRFIVQPAGTRQLSLHEISIDSLRADQGAYRTPSFLDTLQQIQKCRAQGVNCVYLAGVFERDNEESSQVYRRPHASPTALTHRTLPCRMLGGAEQFKKLIEGAHKLGVRVLVDCSTRVSSSRMSRRYDPLRLKSVDEQGRVGFHYGCGGRSISYEDTTPLNYRKKAAWDLLLAEVMEVVERFGIDGIYLDNGFEWPQVFRINEEELYRRDSADNSPVYSNDQIFEGEVVLGNKPTGYWTAKSHLDYANPLLVKLCKTLWEKYPNLVIIAEGLQIEDNDSRLISVLRSGPIPRTFKLPKALGQVVGVGLGNNGEVGSVPPRNINSLRQWYEQVMKSLPKGAVMINSTSSPVWPYPAFVFKKATWAVVDLFFFLADLPMTAGLEQFGRAYKTKSIGINYLMPDDRKELVSSALKQKSFSRANSSFFQEDPTRPRKGNVVCAVNSSLKDPSQVLYLEQNFRREVGPEFGFDLNEIHKHYLHRRQLRAQCPLLKGGRLLLLQAEHLYGVHNNILAFSRYNENQLLLISINFNPNPVDMHYNLAPLRNLFRGARSSIVLKLEDVFDPRKFQNQYYLASELLTSKIEARVEPFKTILWRLTVVGSEFVDAALACSRSRMKERLLRTPPAWIYSSVLFNELGWLLEQVKTRAGIVQGLNQLYAACIAPAKIDFCLAISKNHDFYLNKHKLEKLFGVFKLVENHPQLDVTLKERITSMLSGNTLGPIVFVTPEIGSWTSVGGLGVMVDELAKELVRLGEQVYIFTPFYQYNKKRQTDYIQKDGFTYERNIKVRTAHLEYEFGIHRGKHCGVNFVWYHNPELFSQIYEGEGAAYVTKQMVFFALINLQAFCQLKIFPSIVVTNDWMCGFVSAYVKCRRYKQVFDGTKFMHICHNLDVTYEGRVYPKPDEGALEWLVQLPLEWYFERKGNKAIINPSKCALQTCDNWGTVSHSYKHDLLRQSSLANVLWKHPHPFSFPNGIRKDQRLAVLQAQTPGSHLPAKKILQQKYFKCQDLKDEIPMFAFIGRITKQKGVHLILDAAQALIHQSGFKVHFLVGGMADSKQDYGKSCADKMNYLNHKYPQCFWSSPSQFFSDGPLVNIGADYSLMPSLFEPGGIVQHEFFCGGTPVVAFRTGGLKDTVFEFDRKTQKGNGFNFMSYDLQDFKRCLRRALDCYKDRAAYQKLRENAFESVVEEQDVARGWNNEFYRLQNKIYIDWMKVEQQIQKFSSKQEEGEPEVPQLLKFEGGEYWRPSWEQFEVFREVLRNASRLKVKPHAFVFTSKRIPRPKQIFVCGSWDDWKTQTRLNFDKIHKNYKVSLRLKPGTYHYKYIDEGEWILTDNEFSETDGNNNINHVITIE